MVPPAAVVYNAIGICFILLLSKLIVVGLAVSGIIYIFYIQVHSTSHNTRALESEAADGCVICFASNTTKQQPLLLRSMLALATLFTDDMAAARYAGIVPTLLCHKTSRDYKIESVSTTLHLTMMFGSLSVVCHNEKETHRARTLLILSIRLIQVLNTR